MVTRTIIETVCNTLVVSLENPAEPKTENVNLYISGEYDSTADALKVLKKTRETDTLKVVTVLSMERQETLYGMPESVFIANATILPPRGTKEE